MTELTAKKHKASRETPEGKDLKKRITIVADRLSVARAFSENNGVAIEHARIVTNQDGLRGVDWRGGHFHIVGFPNAQLIVETRIQADRYQCSVSFHDPFDEVQLG